MTTCDIFTEMPKFSRTYFSIVNKNTYQLINVLVALSNIVTVHCSILVTSISVQIVLGIESKYKLLYIYMYVCFHIYSLPDLMSDYHITSQPKTNVLLVRKHGVFMSLKHFLVTKMKKVLLLSK